MITHPRVLRLGLSIIYRSTLKAYRSKFPREGRGLNFEISIFSSAMFRFFNQARKNLTLQTGDFSWKSSFLVRVFGVEVYSLWFWYSSFLASRLRGTESKCTEGVHRSCPRMVEGFNKISRHWEFFKLTVFCSAIGILYINGIIETLLQLPSLLKIYSVWLQIQVYFVR